MNSKSGLLSPLFGLQILAVLSGFLWIDTGIFDPDMGWQLFGGAWTVAHQRLPDYDPINSLNSYWHNYHWLAQIVLHKLYLLGGPAVLVLLLGVLLALLFVVVIEISLKAAGPKPLYLITALSFMLSAALIQMIVSARVQIFALVVVAVVQLLLMSAPRKGEIPALLLVTVLLANMHVYWIFVPFLWFVYRVGPTLLRKSANPGRALSAGFLLVLGGAATPYGINGYWLLLEYLQMPVEMKNSILELQSALVLPREQLTIFLLCLVFAIRMVNWQLLKTEPEAVVLFTTGTLLALRSVKFLPIFVLFAIPLLVRAATVALHNKGPAFDRIQSKAAAPLSLLLLLFAVFSLSQRWTRVDPLKGGENYPLTVCQQAADFFKDKGARHGHIRIATHFDYGGWCRFAAYQAQPQLDLRVSSDGRTQGVPLVEYLASGKMFGLWAGWREQLQRLNPDGVVVKKGTPLYEGLLLLPDWDLFTEEENFGLFLPVGST